MIKRIEQYLQERCEQYVGDFEKREYPAAEAKLKSMESRDAKILNVRAHAMNIKSRLENDKETVQYRVHWEYFIKQKDFYYIEEEIESRVAVFERGECLRDEEAVQTVPEKYPESVELQYESIERLLYSYDRLKAIQYAERYWSNYNSAYKSFGDDCTNFISQCLHAGGAPMWGQSNRSKGWWYSGESWSWSWTVANALSLLLQNSKVGVRALQVSSPQELMLGDIICYDFEGDGRINHNTIVTAKDTYEMPLVNAHTYDSRMRYWSYEDSNKYTPQIQYRFYHIVDDA